MKKNLIELLILFASILLMGILGAIYSLIFAGVVGWAAIGIAPGASFGLVQRYICPVGGSFEAVTLEPGASQADSAAKAITCKASDGTISKVPYASAVKALVGMLFLICFLLTFIPGAIAMRMSIHSWAQRFYDGEPVSVTPDDE